MLEKAEAFAEQVAGQLAGSGFDVNVAADTVEVEREGVDEALSGVELEAAAGVVEVLLQNPGRFIDFAMSPAVEFLVQDVEVALGDAAGVARDEFGQGAIEAVMVVSDFRILYREGEDSLLALHDTEEPPGQLISRRFSGDEELRGAAGPGRERNLGQVGYENDLNSRQQCGDGGGNGGDGLVEVLAEIVGGEGNGGGEVAEAVAQRHHLRAEMVREVLETEMR